MSKVDLWKKLRGIKVVSFELVLWTQEHNLKENQKTFWQSLLFLLFVELVF